MSEAYYDEHISPKLMALAKECDEQGMSLLAVCEFSPGDIARTLTLQKELCMELKLALAVVEARGNLDAFLMAVERYARKHGHSSIFLTQRGIPLEPST